MYLVCLKPLGMESKEIKDSAIQTGDGAAVGGKEVIMLGCIMTQLGAYQIFLGTLVLVNLEKIFT